jgi:hypothetical protein
MLHHLSFAVSDLARSAAFYDAALAPLGYVRAWTHEIDAGYREAAVGYGLPGADDAFAIRLRSTDVVVPGDGFHLAFRAPSREAVMAFHRAALAQAAPTMAARDCIRSMARTISRPSCWIPTATASRRSSMARRKLSAGTERRSPLVPPADRRGRPANQP